MSSASFAATVSGLSARLTSRWGLRRENRGRSVGSSTKSSCRVAGLKSLATRALHRETGGDCSVTTSSRPVRNINIIGALMRKLTFIPESYCSLVSPRLSIATRRRSGCWPKLSTPAAGKYRRHNSFRALRPTSDGLDCSFTRDEKLLEQDGCVPECRMSASNTESGTTMPGVLHDVGTESFVAPFREGCTQLRRADERKN